MLYEKIVEIFLIHFSVLWNFKLIKLLKLRFSKLLNFFLFIYIPDGSNLSNFDHSNRMVKNNDS
jgi:hypothetical protein